LVDIQLELILGYSCCKKRVISFDEFLTLPGCTSGSHSTEQVAKPAPVSTTSNTSVSSGPTSVDGGVETYGSVPAKVIRTSTPQLPTVEEKKPEPLEQDDLSIPVEKGTKCTRKGCNAEFISEEISRGEGDEAKCVFHPGYSIQVLD
jgi:CHORD